MSAAPQPGEAPRPDEAGPHRLSLAGVTPDGTLLLTDGDGATFSLEIDARVRAALPDRREPPMQTQPESVLRPRDIQARIRSGESPEQVAAAAQTTVEKVMPFAGPVLAEREHIAGRAQRSSVRRPAGAAPAEAGARESGARALGDIVAARLRHLDLDPTDVVTWDAWRREDGRWSLTGAYAVSTGRVARKGSAHFTFDPPGNFVTLDDDDARWLVGDLPDVEPEAAIPEPRPGVRRLAAVHDRSAEREPVQGNPAVVGDEDQLSIDDALALGADTSSDRAGEEPSVDTSVAGTVDPASQPVRRPVRKTRGRASVPSWDEIMFGPGD